MRLVFVWLLLTRRFVWCSTNNDKITSMNEKLLIDFGGSILFVLRAFCDAMRRSNGWVVCSVIGLKYGFAVHVQWTCLQTNYEWDEGWFCPNTFHTVGGDVQAHENAILIGTYCMNDGCTTYSLQRGCIETSEKSKFNVPQNNTLTHRMENTDTHLPQVMNLFLFYSDN